MTHFVSRFGGPKILVKGEMERRNGRETEWGREGKGEAQRETERQNREKQKEKERVERRVMDLRLSVRVSSTTVVFY